jgi:hypothetical protein
MSIIIYGIFDNATAAEQAAARLKRRVQGAGISGISKQSMPDNSEETTIYTYPFVSPYMGAMNYSSYMPTAIMNGDLVASLHDANLEPQRSETVKLRVRVSGPEAARSASLIMRSAGGRDINQVTS